MTVKIFYHACSQKTLIIKFQIYVPVHFLERQSHWSLFNIKLKELLLFNKSFSSVFSWLKLWHCILQVGHVFIIQIWCGMIYDCWNVWSWKHTICWRFTAPAYHKAVQMMAKILVKEIFFKRYNSYYKYRIT